MHLIAAFSLPYRKWIILSVAALVLSGGGVLAVWFWSRDAGQLGADEFRDSMPDLAPIQRPLVQSAESTWLHGDEEVIGVSAGGRHRAYLVRAFIPVQRHVVNDELGNVPVTVSYCDRNDCAMVFVGPTGGGPLEFVPSGYSGLYDLGFMVLRVGAWHYRQDTGDPVEREAPPLACAKVDFVRTTWERWRRAHPDTDVFVGLPVSGEQLKGYPLWDAVRDPIVHPAGEVEVRDDAEVIGVSAGGRHRAYVIMAMTSIDRHVLNDQLGGVPVAVSFCGLSECVQVLMGTSGQKPTDIAVGPFCGEYDWGTQILRVGQWHYQQDTGLAVEKDAPPFPYGPAAFERTTWKRWREAHPDTDVHVGEAAATSKRRTVE